MALRHRIALAAARMVWRLWRPRTIGVRAVVTDGASHVALVRHTYLAQWYLPGGGVKRRESAVDALRRELREEIALDDITVERVLGVYHNLAEGKDDHVIVFVVRTPLPRPAIAATDPREIEAARWFPIDALPHDLSPATRRRLAEHARGASGAGAW